ncbi:hypothetical protein [Gelidibacter sp.]|uniref:hypothetical protein n=1 Tax=Gelidibacter sp. TaxID=2018083 RepID=UPI003263E033
MGLIALLLLSPCKVRNSIQTALELPQTEVSSKSVCQVYEENETLVSATTTNQQQQFPAIPYKQPHFALVTVDLAKQTVTQIEDKSESVALIPYYILYQNLKVHL